MTTRASRDRLKVLTRKHPVRRSLFNRILWISTAVLVLQFFIPEALNSCEQHWKREEVCDPCLTPPGGIHFCPLAYGPDNRVCPACGREWSAPPYRAWSDPWIFLAVKVLLRWA